MKTYGHTHIHTHTHTHIYTYTHTHTHIHIHTHNRNIWPTANQYKHMAQRRIIETYGHTIAGRRSFVTPSRFFCLSFWPILLSVLVSPVYPLLTLNPAGVNTSKRKPIVLHTHIVMPIVMHTHIPQEYNYNYKSTITITITVVCKYVCMYVCMYHCFKMKRYKFFYNVLVR